MILVAIVAGLMEEYTALLTRILEHLLTDAPFPGRVRFLILRNLPFVLELSRNLLQVFQVLFYNENHMDDEVDGLDLSD
uniref:Uncharacterized protein n=1 Tax=Salix viminalis TaxID=40686 RepID=A0A6N2N709_SALVM